MLKWVLYSHRKIFMGSHFLYKHSILSDFVYIHRKLISGLDTLSLHFLRIKSAPSSLHACLTYAPSSQKLAHVPLRIPLCMRQIQVCLTRPRSIWCGCPCFEAKEERREESEEGQQIDLQNPSRQQLFTVFSASFKSALMFDIFDTE